MRNITILDIARELHISKSTVSRALANHPNVHPDTRKRVLEVAQFYDYQPNMIAKSLLQQKTYNLGVVIPDIQKPFYAAIVSGIQQTASQAGYRIIITQSNESVSEETSNIEALVRSRVDGLLVCHTRATEEFKQIHRLHKKGLRIVEFARVCPDLPVSTVVENDVDGAYAVVRHLLDKGAKRVGLLSGPKGLTVSRLRETGYRKALDEAGITVEQKWIAHTRFLNEDIEKAVEKWMGARMKPDAIFSIYDAGAVDAMQWLQKSGQRIPEDIQVAGFGDDPSAALVRPSLTTYSQTPLKIGQVACNQMLRILSDKNAAVENQIVRGELVVRNSTRL